MLPAFVLQPDAVAPGAHPHKYTPAEANTQTLALLRLIGFSCQPYLTVRCGATLTIPRSRPFYTSRVVHGSPAQSCTS